MDIDIPVTPIPFSTGNNHHPQQIPIATATSMPTRPATALMQLRKSMNEASLAILQQQQQQKSCFVSERQLNRLKHQGFTHGLIDSLSDSISKFPLRIWVVDNSGSMASPDGNRFIKTQKSNDIRIVQCTRWKEIQDVVEYHSQLAAALNAPTMFRLLNNDPGNCRPQNFGVADKQRRSAIHQDLELAQEIMRNTSPTGVTPLSRHVRDIASQISIMAPQLRQQGQRVAVILATDGLPTDGRGNAGTHEQQDFVHSLQSLEGLPCWIVIRLCTDEANVVEFYNQIDAQLELSVEVMDDFVKEAHEIHKQNPWLNYALPLHRAREFGFSNRLMDLLDERPLTLGEIGEFCSVLLFGQEEHIPDPCVDFHAFLKKLEQRMEKEGKEWNPVKRKVASWINIKALKRRHRQRPRLFRKRR